MLRRRNLFIKLLLLSMTLMITLGACSKNEGHADGLSQLVVGENGFSPANYKQYASYIQLGAHDGKLYMWNGWEHTLSCFEGGVFETIAKFDGSWIGIQNGYFYYKSAKGDGKYTVCSYSLENGEHISLTTIGSISGWDLYFTENALCIPENAEKASFRVICDSQVSEDTQQNETYIIGEKAYVLEGKREEVILMCYSTDGSEEPVEVEVPYGLKSMIPCENGLLIHNETNGDFLYFVEAETGNVVELFTVDCIYAYSAVNVHGGYVYLSFVRYTEFGPLGLSGKFDEDDALNGTYRISLEDYSVEKISDEIYNGLFIFDDTGIYACKRDYRVCKLDFDGTVLMELTE